MPRTVLLRDWLDRHLVRSHTEEELKNGYSLEPASADASFRRYFRVSLPDGSTRIVMDAPPELEDCRPFLEVAALLKVEIPTENNKLITPKLTLEVIPSSLNSLTPTEEIAFPASAGA